MPKRAGSDEHYILDLCDVVLSEVGKRGHRFPFLLGDEGKHGRAQLPVDAFYERARLVIEYHERQHFEAVAHFDKPDRMTVSGVHRGEQRKRYDQLRRDILPKNNLSLVELRFDQFAHHRGILQRNEASDKAVLERALSPYVRPVV